MTAIVLSACSSPTHAPDAANGDSRGADSPAASLPASDDFAGGSLDSSWTVLDASKVTAVVGGGALSLTPHANALWYNAMQGGLVFKLVTGDFTATTTVHARKASNASVPPDLAIELGGVMARDPNGSTENYVLIVIGFGEQGRLAVEHKTTRASASTFAESPFGPDAELRLCRQGATFTVYNRTVGATTWTQDFQIMRSDLPATLQVGPNAYDGEAAPDVTISFDQFAFASVGAGCTQ